MQVINGGDFDQKNVLVGQSGKTQAFGVTNDPILMGILSTGLYANPMRTMIQEVMFNAWDAHRMGKCLDKPIDIYINDTSGLIFRDYGPGIAPDMMVPTYCIYGNSTKRNDDEATGGFGLGSKSPYAYTDSFTVTSHHQQAKSMYVMNRVSEENGGGPGMSPIIENVPTDQSGLMITIPLKTNSDMDRAYRYIQELLPMSGIKANIHYMDKTELVTSNTVEPGTWKVSDESAGQIWAVYGGVRYRIVEDEAYEDSFNFVRQLSNLIGNIYIGFKASSLTPLPSREGLNLNERTVENIRNQLEIIEESFQNMLKPAVRIMLNESIKSMKASEIEPKFLAQRWNFVGEKLNLAQVVDVNHPVLQSAWSQKPDDVSDSMWKSICNLIYKNTGKAEKYISLDKFLTMKYIVWAKNFPNHTHYKNTLMRVTKAVDFKKISQIESPITSAELIHAKNIVDEATGRNNDLRGKDGGTWTKLSNIRSAGKVDPSKLSYAQEKILKSLSKDKIKLPTKEYPDRLWDVKTGMIFENVYCSKTIILAKTITSLKDTRIDWQDMFSSKYSMVTAHNNFHYQNFGDTYYTSIYGLAGALIVHQSKGDYDVALKTLRDAGYRVIEADEPKKRVRPTKQIAADGTLVPTSTVPTYPLLNLQIEDWADRMEVDNPTCYLTITEHKVRHGYYHEKPSTILLNYINNHTPRMVILHSKVREGRLQKKGIPSYATKLHSLVEKQLSNEDRVKQMILYHEFKEMSNLPESIRNLPEVQKHFKVPYIRTAQLKNFVEDYNVLQHLNNSNRSAHTNFETTLLVQNKFRELRNDPSVLLVRQISKKCSFFDEREMKYFLQDKKPGEIKVFSEKLLRFLRTV